MILNFTGIGVCQKGPLESRFLHLDCMVPEISARFPRPSVWSTIKLNQAMTIQRLDRSNVLDLPAECVSDIALVLPSGLSYGAWKG
jgi:hypothetical protein